MTGIPGKKDQAFHFTIRQKTEYMNTWEEIKWIYTKMYIVDSSLPLSRIQVLPEEPLSSHSLSELSSRDTVPTQGRAKTARLSRDGATWLCPGSEPFICACAFTEGWRGKSKGPWVPEGEMRGLPSNGGKEGIRKGRWQSEMCLSDREMATQTHNNIFHTLFDSLIYPQSGSTPELGSLFLFGIRVPAP